jgi:hypothetical protein
VKPDPETGDPFPNPVLRTLMRREARQVKGCHSCQRGVRVLDRWACENDLRFPWCQQVSSGYVPKERS